MTRKVPQIVKEWCASIQDRSPQQQLSFYSKDNLRRSEVCRLLSNLVEVC